MKKSKKIIVNIGLARCGTTAAATLFAQGLPGFSTPRGVKELKYFLKDHAGPTDYFDYFDFTEEDILFESSPPYMHNGLEKFSQVLDRIMEVRDLGVEITILVHVKNLIKRAFSHYWHDISSHHSIYGSVWAVREVDDPQRYNLLHTQAFAGALNKPKNKFLPRMAEMLSLAIAKLGEENVCILHTPSMDAGLDDLLDRLNVQHEGVRTPRISGARSPLYLNGGQSYSFADGDTVKEIEIPEGCCLLFARHHQERLDTKKYDIARIIEASDGWSRSFEKADLKPELSQKIRTYLDNQGSLMSSLPEGCFLGGCRDELLKDVVSFPETMNIKPLEPTAAAVQTLLAS